MQIGEQMAKYVDLSERVSATFYSDEYEEWTQRTVTIADVLDSVCDDYTVRLSTEPDRKPGHWEWNKRTGEYECSECGCNPTYEGMTPDESEIDKYRYCRWCGTPMEVHDGKENG